MQKENKSLGVSCGDCVFQPICPHCLGPSTFEQCYYFVSKSIVEENRRLMTENINLKMQVRRLVRETLREKKQISDETQEEKPFGWYFYE